MPRAASRPLPRRSCQTLGNIGVSIELAYYALPALPAAVRLLVVVRFSGYMGTVLPEAALDRLDHRTVYSAFASISLAALLALVALPGDLKARQLPVWFMLVSFLLFLGALNLQTYKAKRWQDFVGDAMFEGATLALISAVIAFILVSEFPFEYKIAALTIATVVWLIDFSLRVFFAVSYLRSQEQRDGL